MNLFKINVNDLENQNAYAITDDQKVATDYAYLIHVPET